MIDAARYAPTGYNKQPVRYAIISSPEKVAEAFGLIGWLTGKPSDDEKPAAYIVVMCDTEVNDSDVAAAAATYAIQLAAHALGYGSCWHGASAKVRDFLGLGENINPKIIVSLGKYGEMHVVHDPSDDWQVKKAEDGVIHLGKLGREKVTLAVM
jgi:nitroreductase